MIPLYQRPTPLIHKSGLLGMVNNPGLNGVYWDVEDPSAVQLVTMVRKPEQ